MKKNIILVIILFTTTTFISYGQENWIKKGDQNLENLFFADAIKDYEKAIKSGAKSENVYIGLAEAYYFNGMYTNANKWYTKAFELPNKTNFSADIYYRYVQSLKSQQNYDEADRIMNIMAQKYGQDNRVKLFIKNKNYLKDINNTPQGYEVFPIKGLNSAASDFGGAWFGKELVFTSARRNKVSNNIHYWTNSNFTKLFSATIDDNTGIAKDVKFFNTGLDSKYNESSAIFTNNGNVMYLTSNEINGAKSEKDQVNHVSIFKLIKDGNGKWGNPLKLSFNSTNYDDAHPAITPDGQWMYFVSDRNGGFGQSDIYRVRILSDGSFGIPENLGEQINTEGRETFPFISNDNILFFSSDGHPGLGGLDVFAVRIFENGEFGEVVNVGLTVNSSFDDFAFNIQKNKTGLVSSNRANGEGKDDIYFVRELSGLKYSFYQTIVGKVYDRKSNTAIQEAEIVFKDASGNTLAVVKTDINGEFKISDVENDKGYTIQVSNTDFNSVDIKIPLLQRSMNGVAFDIGLDKTVVAVVQPEVKLEKGDDLFKKLALKPIYFENNKAEIIPSASLELFQISEIMKVYPNLKIDIRSHTDSRGPESYNLVLSEKRANATKEWLVQSGIENFRITAKGYGDTMPVNSCTKNVKCSDAQYQENRRSEFIVVDL